MILWSVDRLVQMLRDGALSERQKLHYVIAGVVVQAMLGRTLGIREALAAYSAFLTLAVSIAVGIGGVWLAFRANEGGDNRAFIDRYLCLAIPLVIRMYALYVVMWVLLLLLIPAARDAAAARDAWNPFAAVIQLIAWIWFFAALRKYVGRAAGNPTFITPLP